MPRPKSDAGCSISQRTNFLSKSARDVFQNISLFLDTRSLEQFGGIDPVEFGRGKCAVPMKLRASRACRCYARTRRCVAARSDPCPPSTSVSHRRERADVNFIGAHVRLHIGERKEPVKARIIGQIADCSHLQAVERDMGRVEIDRRNRCGIGPSGKLRRLQPPLAIVTI